MSKVVLPRIALEEIASRPGSFSVVESSKGFIGQKSIEKRLLSSFQEDCASSGVLHSDTVGKGLKFALEEILENAREHGNRFNPNKTINVTYSFLKHEAGGASLYIVVEDEGNGFVLGRDYSGARKRGFGLSESMAFHLDLLYNFGEPQKPESRTYLAKAMPTIDNPALKIIVSDTPIRTRQRPVNTEPYFVRPSQNSRYDEAVPVEIYDLLAIDKEKDPSRIRPYAIFMVSRGDIPRFVQAAVNSQQPTYDSFARPLPITNSLIFVPKEGIAELTHASFLRFHNSRNAILAPFTATRQPYK